MEYFITSQGMDNSKYGLIISNGEELEIEDNRRQSILKEIRGFEERSQAYYTQTDTKVFVDMETLLINTYSKNKDVTDRIVPVSILIIKGYDSPTFPEKFSEIIDVLKRYGILLDSAIFTISQKAINKYKSKLRRNHFILTVIALIIVTIGLILILNGLSNE